MIINIREIVVLLSPTCGLKSNNVLTLVDLYLHGAHMWSNFLKFFIKIPRRITQDHLATSFPNFSFHWNPQSLSDLSEFIAPLV